ncbi:hypothetical protein N9L92_00420 [Saprospiraceae bacterium]|nr:hypothetical protein [Saprospiraceae bacterium]
MSRSRSISKFVSSPYWMLNLSLNFIEYRFEPIKAFVISTKAMIEKEQKELKLKFNDFEKNRPEGIENYPDAYDIFETEIMNQGEYSKLLYNSMFLTIYSTLEAEFNKICTICRNAESFKLKYDDLAGGNYLQQSKDYLTKVVDVDLSIVNEEWKKLKIYQVLRNSIAHKKGKFITNQKHQIEFVENTKAISVEPKTKNITIESEEFLNDFIDISVSFLVKISDSVVKQKKG